MKKMILTMAVAITAGAAALAITQVPVKKTTSQSATTTATTPDSTAQQQQLEEQFRQNQAEVEAYQKMVEERAKACDDYELSKEEVVEE